MQGAFWCFFAGTRCTAERHQRGSKQSPTKATRNVPFRHEKSIPLHLISKYVFFMWNRKKHLFSPLVWYLQIQHVWLNLLKVWTQSDWQILLTSIDLLWGGAILLFIIIAALHKMSKLWQSKNNCDRKQLSTPCYNRWERETQYYYSSMSFLSQLFQPVKATIVRNECGDLVGFLEGLTAHVLFKWALRSSS